MPRFFTIESDTITNVARRKNMMSISGMISIRACRLALLLGISMALSLEEEFCPARNFLKFEPRSFLAGI